MIAKFDIRLSGPFQIFSVWGIECGGSDFEPSGRRYRRRVRIGWLTFDAGEYAERPVGSSAYWQALYEHRVRAAVKHLEGDRDRRASDRVKAN